MSAQQTPSVPLKKVAPPAEEPKKEEKGLNEDAITKYTNAGQTLGEVFKKFLPSVTPGKKVLDLCVEGDKCVTDTLTPLFNKNKNGAKIVKGQAFPTSISVNNVVSHVSPLQSDPEVVLKEGDVVKIMIGIQLDGYPVIHAETIHLNPKSDSPTTDAAADVIRAAYDAAQVAMRTIKVGAKNWDVTEAVEKVAKDYGCTGVEGMLSCQHEKDVSDGKKRILLNPTPELKREHETVVFEEGDVYGVDILVVTGSDGKAKADPARTSIYKKGDVNYQLKMKTSRTVFSELQKKAGAFPFTLRLLDDERRARMGVQEAVAHGLLKPYDVVQTAPETIVAQFFFTIGLLPGGPSLFSPAPVWYSEDKVKSSKSISDEETKNLLTKPLRASKKKKAKTAAEGAAETKA